jgi:hypothetical protein
MLRTRAPRLVAAAALVATVALGLSACSSGPISPKAVSDYKGEPKGVDAPSSSAGGAPWAAWSQNGAQFTVTLYGSSTCPPVGTKYTVTGKQQLKITLKDWGKRPCTQDYVPHTTVFSTPKAVDSSLAVRITAQQVAFTLEGKK